MSTSCNAVGRHRMASKGLPEDLIVEVLARLPVKSLMRFKCLSKFYLTVITEYSFINKHFRFSTKRPHLLIFHCQSELSSKPCISLFSEELLQPLINSGLQISEPLQAPLDLGLPVAKESQSPIDLGSLVSEPLQAPLDLGLPVAEESQPPIDTGLSISETSQDSLDLGLQFAEDLLTPIDLSFLDISQPLNDLIPETSQPPIDTGLSISEISQDSLDLGLQFAEDLQPPIDLSFLDISQPLNDLIPETSQPAVALGVTFPESSLLLFDARLLFPDVSQAFANWEQPIPEVSQPPVNLELPFLGRRLRKIVPYGPCNGIFCLYGSYFDSPDQFILWNPATKEVKVLPLPNHPLSGMEMCTHGFGIDPKTNDYKVVSVSVLTLMELQLAFEHLGETQIPWIEVYSLRTNSWRRINVAIPASNFGDSFYNAYLNGVYHWLAMNSEMIVCFDMSDEVFYKMKVPPVIESYTHEHLIDCNVAVLGDCIAFVKEYCSQIPLGHRIEIWVMNEYGVEESWTKCFSIGPLMGNFQGFWKDSEIVVTGEDHETLVFYNLDTQQPVLKIPFDCGLMFFPTVTYVESMFPLSVMAEDSGVTTRPL